MEENKTPKAGLFEKGGRLGFLHSTVDAFDTFLRVPGTVTRTGAHIRDAVDLKRVMIMVVIALVPAALFGMWNVGYQHNLATGITDATFISTFFYGFLKVLPLYVISYAVGLFIEFAGAQIKGEEVNEGYLVSGFLIPLIVPVDIPLWMLAIAVAFAVLFGKEVFGGTGMNFLNPALLARAFLFFSYPTKMSGSETWISLGKDTPIDGFTGATPLSFANEGIDALTNAGAQYGTDVWSLFAGTVPGSVGETSVIAILIGAAILLMTGVASWKIMCSSVLGALFVGWLGNIAGATTVPAWMQLLLGGFAFGTVFMATDPVTSAQTECGKWIYGFLIGAVCITVRLFNPGYPEGMMLAILLLNTFAPLIDWCVTSWSISRRNKKLKTA